MAVKKIIEDIQGKDKYPCGQQILIYKGKVLKDESSIAEIKICEDGFLVLMLSKASNLFYYVIFYCLLFVSYSLFQHAIMADYKYDLKWCIIYSGTFLFFLLFMLDYLCHVRLCHVKLPIYLYS